MHLHRFAHTSALAALSLAAGLATAGEPPRRPGYDQSPGYGPIMWPLRRQHLLAGHYIGLLHLGTPACADARADLVLQATPGQHDSHHYTLTTNCLDGRSAPQTLRADWWVDEIAGSCLILEHPADPQFPPPYPLYGFRIDDAAVDIPFEQRPQTLAQDGGSCQSGMPEEYTGKLLRRVD